MNIDVKAIGERVRELREARGWSQDELAAKAGIAQTTVSRIERGVTAKPTLAGLGALAASLGVVVEELAPAEATAETEETAHSTTETEAATPANASEIARRIQEIARERGWTLREFARRANLPSGYVGTLVSRIRRTPNTGIEAETLRKIANGARVSLEWLVSGDGERDAATLTASDAITAAEALRLVETIDPRLLRALVRMRPAARDALLAMLEAL